MESTVFVYWVHAFGHVLYICVHPGQQKVCKNWMSTYKVFACTYVPGSANLFLTFPVQEHCLHIHVVGLYLFCSNDPSNLAFTHAHVLYIRIKGSKGYKVSRNVKQGYIGAGPAPLTATKLNFGTPNLYILHMNTRCGHDWSAAAAWLQHTHISQL